MNPDNNLLEPFAYMIAAEKLTNMVSTIDQTMSFMEEYKIKPDVAVKMVLTPILDQVKNWLKDE